MIKLLPNRIREFRERAGLSMQALAEKAGTSAPQINKLEKGERKLTVDWMIRIGHALAVEPRELMVTDPASPERRNDISKSDNSSQEPVAFPDGLVAGTIDFGRPDLPIRGRAQGGATGVLMLPNEQQPVDWAYRPPQLRGVPEAFGIFVYDDSMHPMYKHGQTLWVHPHLPVKPGDGVLVIKQSNEALVKELVRRTTSEIILRQYRPQEEQFSLATAEIRALYRIVGALDVR